MNRRLLVLGGSLTFALGLFKIAMSYIFGWREAMGSGEAFLWTTVYAENLGISLLLLFFAYMSIFQCKELLDTGIGRTIMLAVATLWVYRAAAEVFLYKPGLDGAWWRVFLFLVLAVSYLLPLAASLRERTRDKRALAARLGTLVWVGGTNGERHEQEDEMPG